MLQPLASTESTSRKRELEVSTKVMQLQISKPPKVEVTLPSLEGTQPEFYANNYWGLQGAEEDLAELL